MIRREGTRRMNRVGALLVRETRKSINVSNMGGAFPSLPFHPPHRGDGDLRNSIRYDVSMRRGGRELVCILSANTPYAARLEYGFFGTDDAGRLVSQAPRPYLRRALMNNVANIQIILGAS